MKYVVLITDGASGWPVETFAGRTTLEAAEMPNLDRMARTGVVGLAATVPDGMEPSSAVACMSVMGYDPSLFYAGRGPIEALALSIDLEPGQVALRCNLVCVDDGAMRSYSAGNISSSESHVLMAAIQSELGDRRVRFHPGVGFRHILTVREGRDLLATRCVPPHDLADQQIGGHLPDGPAADLLLDLMERSKPILAAHPVNRGRKDRGELPATQIWPFWPGVRPAAMPSFREKYGLRAALTSPVDLLRGIANQLGIDVLEIAGVTDGPDNDYGAQMKGALKALGDHDLVIVHVEAPDAAGHDGDAEGKRTALERIDVEMASQLWEREGGLRVLVMPDHPTPLALRTHAAEPVPFIIWGEGSTGTPAPSFTESAAAGTGLLVPAGHELMAMLLG
ncbi:MAG TPA: cofactor-independent phosphoglycerate mutase [Thermoleophilia bacterium]|nr:cofactor-independent phosphoglycerate mutase [Thermoleophilia bacterium]